MFDEIFRRKKAIPEKLLAYGFRKEKNGYKFDTYILDGDFYLNIRISKSDLISTTLVEAATGEEYILYKKIVKKILIIIHIIIPLPSAILDA